MSGRSSSAAPTQTSAMTPIARMTPSPRNVSVAPITNPRRVPNHVPDPADLTPPYSTEPDEASLKRRRIRAPTRQS